MNNEAKERLTLGPTDGELQRRWKAVRAEMEAGKIDVLVMQNDNQFLGGYTQWFTDYAPRAGYAMTIIFPFNDEMTTITHGGAPPSDVGPAAWTIRGAKTRLTANYFSSLHYSGTYDAELVVKTIKARKDRTVGVVNTRCLPYMFCEYVRRNLPGVKFVDATDIVDEIKAVKSAEEIGFLMGTVALQDAAMAYAKTVIKPGRRDFEIIADVIHKVMELGSEEQLVLGASGPLGTPVPIRGRHFQNRMVREGDQFTLMIEVNGPGGIYGEMGRCFIIGDVPAVLYDANELIKEIRNYTVSLLKPGADPKEIWDAYNKLVVTKGQLPESRVYAHGQGYSLVERPTIRNDEPMKLKANMNITVHPTVSSSTYWLSMWDNWLVTETGVSERLHKTPEEIFSI
jgi:Xaa-Pro aminopeptidase